MKVSSEGQGLVTMALWFTAKGSYSKWIMSLFHVAIITTLIGKNFIMGFILYHLGGTSCDAFVAKNVGIIIAKSLAIVFMSVKLMSNIPERLMLRYSAEFKRPGATNMGGCGRFPFGFYTTWQILTDMYITWLSVTLALAKVHVIDVFANFAAILIFADAELILGTFVMMVMPIKEDKDFLVFHVRKSKFLERKKRHARSTFVFTALMFILYILVATKTIPQTVFGHCVPGESMEELIEA